MITERLLGKEFCSGYLPIFHKEPWIKDLSGFNVFINSTNRTRPGEY